MKLASEHDIATCDKEPIRIPGSVQPHGALFAFDANSHKLTVVSANAEQYFAAAPDALLGKTVDEVFGKSGRDIMATADTPVLEGRAMYLQRASLAASAPNKDFNIIGHRRDGLLILELEPASEHPDDSFTTLHPVVEPFISRLGQLQRIDELSNFVAAEARRVTGFDRVLVYRFDEDWNGIVVGEDRNERLPSYMHHRFPASDIPAQARELYTLNRLRIIPNAEYEPVPLIPNHNPVTRKPLDLSLSVLRSVSPIHTEYMRNMGTAASMSISIVRDGVLWGLISCHHREPKQVPFETRMACDLMSQMFALQLSAQERHQAIDYRVRLKSVLSELLESMTASEKFIDGLASRPESLLRLTGAKGVAVVTNTDCLLLGKTPDEEQVRNIARWLAEERHSIFETDRLAKHIPEAAEYSEAASGMLAVSISKVHQSFILWFRPELIETVQWAGDPRKGYELPAGARMHPRKSFETWRDTVRGTALPWQKSEIETATEFQNIVLGIVLRKAEELAGLNRELQRSNKELEAFSYSVSHDLRAPFRHIVGYGELLKSKKSSQLDSEAQRYISVMMESARYAGQLVDNLLAFSHMGRAALNYGDVDMSFLVKDVKRELTELVKDRRITWNISQLPYVRGDAMMLKLVVQNLLSNAIKYTEPREEAVIEVGALEADDKTIFHVKDNGVGFDMQYQNKLFGVFQRLHAVEEFEGTGIGLANVKRIVDRHGGDAWAEGQLDQGATFYFSIPRNRSEKT